MPRKRKFYSVSVGREVGVYTTWDDCKRQVHGFSGAVYKSFPTEGQAIAFLTMKLYSDDDNKKKRRRRGSMVKEFFLEQRKELQTTFSRDCEWFAANWKQ
jgi:viroplasmin and RNaseH domain-containing protein